MIVNGQFQNQAQPEGTCIGSRNDIEHFCVNRKETNKINIRYNEFPLEMCNPALKGLYLDAKGQERFALKIKNIYS